METGYLATMATTPAIRQNLVSAHVYPVAGKECDDLLQNSLNKFFPFWVANTKHIVEHAPSRCRGFCRASCAAQGWKGSKNSKAMPWEFNLRDYLKEHSFQHLSGHLLENQLLICTKNK
jgi:hypothetical protein